MSSFDEQRRSAFMSCIEVVLMKRGNTSYHWVQTKLSSSCNCTTIDCYECPEQLRTVLKEIYHEDYNSIIDEIKLRLGNLIEEKDVTNFLKIMEN